jgi:hypothetical protein
MIRQTVACTYLNVSFSGTREGINDDLENSFQWQVFRELGFRSWGLVLEIYLELMIRLAT